MGVRVLEELVEDILERLPTKSLVRFRMVARSWNALSRTNSFIRRHSQRLNGSHERFMIVHQDPHTMPRRTPLVTLLSSNHPTLLHLPPTQYSFIPDLFHIFFYHCNGVICFGIDRKIVLWNPATREVKEIPTREVAFPCSFVYHYSGFGVADRDTFHDFNLIEIYVGTTRDSNNHPVPSLSAEVYSTSTNSWTLLPHLNANHLLLANKLPPFSYDDFNFAFRGCGAYADGVFYWYAFRHAYILCFHFGSNQLRILDTPTGQPGPIFEVRDSIGFVLNNSVCENEEEYVFQIGFQIWILNQQDGSWTKTYNYNIRSLYSPRKEIFAVWKDGAEFLAGYWDWDSESYNSNGERLLQFRCLIGVRKYVESIAPLSL